MDRSDAILVHAVSQYDQRQLLRNPKAYNPHALALYFIALARVRDEVGCGKELRAALVENFTGRLLDVCLKAVGLPKSTLEEERQESRRITRMINNL